MARYSVTEAAQLLGVSDDTVRRWIEASRLRARRGPGGRLDIAGTDLAALVVTQAPQRRDQLIAAASARNRFTGLVTRVVKDTVMAQVEIQAGPHRLVSLMSREAADELGLAPGVRAVAAVKSTNVVVELPAGK